MIPAPTALPRTSPRRGPGTMLLLVIGLGLVLPLAALGPAGAHTDLVSSSPEADGTVADPPIEVVLTFAEAPLAGSQPAARVIDPVGEDLVSAAPTIEGVTVVVPLNLAVHEGVHTVDWAITADDGDDQTGTFTFSFAPPPEIATPQPAAPPEPATVAPTEPITQTPEPPATPTPSSDPTPSPSPTGDDEAASTSTDDGPGAVGTAAAILGVAAAAAGVLLFARARARGVDHVDG